MKNLISIMTLLMLITSCSKTTKLDADVKSDISSAPIADRASILIAVPIVIGVSDLPQEQKVVLLQDFDEKLGTVILLKAEQRKVVATILDKLTDKDYPAAKFDQLVARHSALEDKMTSLKKTYLKDFINNVKGRITDESVQKSLERLEERYNEIEKSNK